MVIGNDNSGVESTVNQFVSDYNSLISAVNTQEGNTSSGTPEPLFGSPTLTLLQQELLSSLNTQNPNGSLAAVTNDLNPTLSGSMTIQMGNGTKETVQIGAAPSGGAANNTIYTGSGTGYNTLRDWPPRSTRPISGLRPVWPPATASRPLPLHPVPRARRALTVRSARRRQRHSIELHRLEQLRLHAL